MKADIRNIAITADTHRMLVEYIELVGGKIGWFADKAIRELVIKELKKIKK